MSYTMRSKLLVSSALAVFLGMGLILVFAVPTSARIGGGGFKGGGFTRPSGGFSRPGAGSVSRPSLPSGTPTPQTSRGAGPQPANQPNRSWTGNNNINTGDINVNSNNGGWGYGWGSGAGLALGAAAATGAAIGSSSDGGATVYASPAPTVVYALPPGCSTVVVGGATYENCNGSYYVPVYQGSSVAYQPVPPPQ